MYWKITPKEILEKNNIRSQRFSMDDSAATLDAIWQELLRSYGDSRKINMELENMIGNCRKFESIDDLNGFKVLLRLCKLISCNVNSVNGI